MPTNGELGEGIHESIPPIGMDTVQKFQAPEVHHAEPVTLRQDETSSSDSESTKEEFAPVQGIQSTMDGNVLSNPTIQPTITSIPSSAINLSNHPVLQDLPQFQYHTTGLPDPSLPPPPPPEELLDANAENGYRNYDDQAFTNYKAMSHREEDEHKEDCDWDNGQQYISGSKKKGGNFFSSLFGKKSGQKRSSKGKGEKHRPKSEYSPTSYTNNQIPDFNAYDPQAFYPVESLSPTSLVNSKSQPDFSMSGFQSEENPGIHRSAFGQVPSNQPIYMNQDTYEGSSQIDNHGNNQHNGALEREPLTNHNEQYDQDFEQQQPRPTLERKRSMSKPTDLDEILRLQEQESLEQEREKQNEPACNEEEQKLRDVKIVTQDNVSDVFKNDPWFQNRPTTKTPSPIAPVRDPDVREVPIHVDQSRNVGQQPIYENYKNLNIQSLLRPLEVQVPKYVPCNDTTQEIDIDAILGYTGDDDSNDFSREDKNYSGNYGIATEDKGYTGNYGIATEIDQIEWPKGSNEEIAPSFINEERIEIDYDPMANFQDSKRKKKGSNFFSFGKGQKKKPKRDKSRQKEYIVPNDQPYSETYDENDALDHEEKPNEITNGVHEELGKGENTTSSSPPSRDSSPERQTKPSRGNKKKQSSGMGLGNFFKTSKKKTSTFVEIVRTVSSEENNTPQDKSIVNPTILTKTQEVQEEINADLNESTSKAPSVASARDLARSSSFDNSAKSQKSPRQKPKGGLKGFFRAPGVKTSRSQTSQHRYGNTQPVDVSHLVDDEFDDEFVEPPLATSQTIVKAVESTGVSVNENDNQDPAHKEELNAVDDNVFIPIKEPSVHQEDIQVSPENMHNIDDEERSDIETIYPKSMATEIDSSEPLNNAEPQENDGCSESSCSSYAGKRNNIDSKSKSLDKQNTVVASENKENVSANGSRVDEILTLDKEEHVSLPPSTIERKEPIEMTPPPGLDTASNTSRGRGRERQKKGGSGFIGLFSSKPPSKPISKPRNQLPPQQSNAGSRSRSLPRRRDSGGKGLSSLFGGNNLPSKRRPPSVDRIHTSTTSLQRDNEAPDHTCQSISTESKQYGHMNGAFEDKSRRSSTSSQRQPKRQNSGLSGLFSTTPKLPSKRNTPTGTPTSSTLQLSSISPAQKKQQSPRRNNTGFSGLFGSSSTGQSGRRQNQGMKRSTTFPISRPQEAPPQPPNAKTTSIAPQSTEMQNQGESPTGADLNPVPGQQNNDLMSSLYNSSNNDEPNQIFEQTESNQAVYESVQDKPTNPSEKKNLKNEDIERIDLVPHEEGNKGHGDLYTISNKAQVETKPILSAPKDSVHLQHLATEQNSDPRLNQESVSQTLSTKPPRQSGRQTGRRAGGFRKQTPDTSITSSVNTSRPLVNNSFDHANHSQGNTPYFMLFDSIQLNYFLCDQCSSICNEYLLSRYYHTK